MKTDFGSHLRSFIGARVFTPYGPAVLICVAETYLTVKLEEGGVNLRFYNDAAVLLYCDADQTTLKKDIDQGLNSNN